MFRWKPYMHTPSLKRWLRRIGVPALVLWGERRRRGEHGIRPCLRRAHSGRGLQGDPPGRTLPASRATGCLRERGSRIRQRPEPDASERLTSRQESAMRFFHFSEQPYPDAWSSGWNPLRNTIPNSYCDPKIAHRIYNERLTEYESCDELGLNVAFNEHHSSATCLSESPTLHAAIVARTTKKARILPLGIPIALRPDPVRVAEEIAMIDCISGGRLEVGLGQGVALRDLAQQCQSDALHGPVLGGARPHPEGPRHARRPLQFRGRVPPLPAGQYLAATPISSRTRRSGSRRAAPNRPSRSRPAATTSRCFSAGRNLKKLMDLYRQRTRELGRPEAGPEKFGYLCLVGVGRTEEEGIAAPTRFRATCARPRSWAKPS